MPTAVVTGGAGFVGSHLCARLISEGWSVVCLDSEITGTVDNVRALIELPSFRFIHADVSEEIPDVGGAVDAVLHLASPASPVDYATHPIATLRVGSVGTQNALDLARRHGARFLLASTSEVYGDPALHPQPESYWGNVNPIGPRSVYDEAKRFAEAITSAYGREYHLNVKIARIFNTYGPRMRRYDGRAVPTFIAQALAGEAMTVHGDGSQTRSLCYVDDLVDGLLRLLVSDHAGPVNLGNPNEITVLELARCVNEVAGGRSEVVFTPRPVDDPSLRCPDISRASAQLGWKPEVELEEGLRRTIAWAREAGW